MDQVKTGNLIALCRKEKGLTQAALAERLGVSDRAVSKWETGRSLPDADNMLELSRILGITVDELLKGEKTGEGGLDQMTETIQKLNTKQHEEETNRKTMADVFRHLQTINPEARYSLTRVTLRLNEK